ncbi:MAG: PLP-dependent aspartate aminotransferase family protein [Paenibacillaceae bacterium]
MNNKEKIESQFTKVSYDRYDDRHHGAVTVPIYQNSLFTFDRYEQFELATQDDLAHHVYSRGNNPTVEYLEQKIAELEEGEQAKCFASGMAAITAAILSQVQLGDHIICVNQVYGPTMGFLGTYLKRFGIETTFVDGSSLEQWKAAIRTNTKLLYLESPTTMFFELQDLRACTELARSIGAITIIDNTWATPCYQQPLTLGVDLVVHSISKYMGGHSDCVGGVVIGSKKRMDPLCHNEYMLFGGIMTPQTAALVTRGLRTLPLRMQRHESTALKVAEHLCKLPFVTQVNYPGLVSHPQHELALRQMSGFSSLLSFETEEPVERMKEWADGLRYFRIGVSWGGFESLVTVRALEAKQDKSSRSLIRLYIGLESPEDLIADIDEAWIG